MLRALETGGPFYLVMTGGNNSGMLHFNGPSWTPSPWPFPCRINWAPGAHGSENADVGIQKICAAAVRTAPSACSTLATGSLVQVAGAPGIRGRFQWRGLRINCFEVQTPSPLYSGKSPAAWQQNWVCIHRPSQRHKDLSPPPIHHPGTAIYFKSRQNYALYLLVWVNRVAQGNSWI